MKDNKEYKTNRYCFTIHNYTKKDLKRFHKLAETLENHRYICYGLEVAPDTGTEHIQGYIELNASQRFTYLHNYFDFTKNGKRVKFHIEPANGSAEQNKKYVSKEGDVHEFGEPVTQGARTDLREIKRAVEENPKRLKEIIREYGNNLQQVKYAQSLQPYYFEHRTPNTPPNVFWLFGSTGVGKTSLVFTTFEDTCSVSSYDWLGTGYLQNECLLFDDFRANNLAFETLLKITDRYPFTLFYKGGQIELNSPYIIFTSPHSIRHTFSRTDEDLKQLLRRCIQINLDNIPDLSEVDLRNLDGRFIYKDDDNYSHHDF
tara:strand:- start:532 stop:1479 length:948 start_codon:yes stop_codon:yes gene_type:complete